MSLDALLAEVVRLIPEATPAQADAVRGQAVVLVPRERLADAFTALRGPLGFDRLVDVTAVDWPERTPRFEVVYQLHGLASGNRLRVNVGVPADDPTVPTASGTWKSAVWGEREVFDMFGIRFTDHPDLRRVLMYPEFEGHPLRKDYPLMQRQPLVAERDPIARPWFPRDSHG